MLTLLIDAHYLCWRAYHTTGKLTYNGDATGVVFGFLRDIETLRSRFLTDRMAFCFDSTSVSKRKQLRPSYKANRNVVHCSPKELNDAESVRRQINQLRLHTLSQLGYLNVFMEPGYEADDIIASICRSGLEKDIIIVSGDADLFQLLRKGVTMYNPRGNENTDARSFQKKYGIEPVLWPMVKAMAGCRSDNIAGVHGIGEKTALKIVRGELPKNHKAVIAVADNQDAVNDNLALVRLPFPGCPEYEIEDQPDIQPGPWREVLRKFGIKSLRGMESQQKGLFP